MGNKKQKKKEREYYILAGDKRMGKKLVEAGINLSPTYFMIIKVNSKVGKLIEKEALKRVDELKTSEKFENLGNKFICKVCGKEEKDQLDLDVWHRGCRLGQFFQRDKKSEKEMGIKKGDGLMVLDITKGKGKAGKELVESYKMGKMKRHKLTKKELQELYDVWRYGK